MDIAQIPKFLYAERKFAKNRSARDRPADARRLSGCKDRKKRAADAKRLLGTETSKRRQKRVFEKKRERIIKIKAPAVLQNRRGLFKCKALFSVRVRRSYRRRVKAGRNIAEQVKK